MRKGLQSVGRGAGTYERTDNPSIFDIATPIVSFLHSYVLTLKLTALAEAFSSPCFIYPPDQNLLRSALGDGQEERTNVRIIPHFIPQRPGNQEFSYTRTLVSCV